jgi:hypothetical protein
MGADIKGTFSLPKFREHFDAKEGITNPELLAALANVVGGVKEAVAA